MTRRDFIWLLGLIGCSKLEPEPVKSTKLFHSFFSGSFNPDPYMDLINLKSINQSQFTLTGSSINSWDDGISAWTQGTPSAKPTLTGGIPLFDGGDQLVRAAEISATSYSLYYVFRNTGGYAKVFLGAQTDSTYFIHQANYNIDHAIGGVGKLILRSGIYSNKRYHIFSVRRSGNTFTVKINDRTAYVTTNNFAGESTKLARLMAISGGFIMTGGVKALMMSSSVLSDTVDQQVRDYLYNNYLAGDTTIENVCGIGDSNTNGQGATSYLVGLASSLGCAYLNLGISGTLFTSGTNNGYGRFQSQIITRPYSDYVVLQYGTNDVSAAVPVATYQPLFDSMVSTLINAGYSPSKICICTIPYQASNLNSSLLNDYRTALQTIATNYGTKYFDLLQAMRDGGADTLLSDTVHLNAAGHTIWQNGVYTALTT